MYSYEAVFEYQAEDCGWLVSFPAFEGAVAFGKTVEAACDNAATVLRLFIAQALDDGMDLPEPTFHEPPRTIVSVEVDEAYRIRTSCVTITEAAAELGVTTGRVSQLVTQGVLCSLEFDGRRYVTIESLNKRKSSRRAAGRPKRNASDIDRKPDGAAVR